MYNIKTFFQHSSDLPISTVLSQQKKKFLPDDTTTNYQRVIVRRRHLWDDALYRFCIGIDFSKYIHVTFVGEPAVDAGGPLREFLYLLMAEVANNNMLFCGDEGCRVLVPSMTALEKETYKYAPTFFAPSVVDYITRGMKGVHPTIDEIPHHHIRRLLEEVCVFVY